MVWQPELEELAYRKELAHRMGGELRLSSSASPTCFTLELPASAPAARSVAGAARLTG